jgi:hypothetical protein
MGQPRGFAASEADFPIFKLSNVNPASRDGASRGLTTVEWRGARRADRLYGIIWILM